MKYINRYFVRFVALLSLAMVFRVPVAFADRLSSQTKSEVKELRAALKKLKRRVSKAAARKTLASISTSGLADSDGDGLPDLFELAIGSSSCDSDSDGDGISDDDESESGSEPDDADSGEIELKGAISGLTETTVTVDGNTFVATESTSYLDGATSLASFEIGDLVEVKGELQGGVLNLIKIKIED